MGEGRRAAHQLRRHRPPRRRHPEGPAGLAIAGWWCRGRPVGDRTGLQLGGRSVLMDTRPLFRGITRKSARIRSAPGGAGNTLRGLTHQPDAAGRGLAMQATRNPFKSEARPEDRHRRPRTPLIIPDRVAERAATAYDEEPESGCWISTYSTG